MTSTTEQGTTVAGAAPDTATLRALHERLVARAQHDGLLDVAYRVVDSPLGGVLVAAGERGVLRVAFAVQGHDAALADLATRVSPRVLEGGSRLDPVLRELDEYFAGTRRTFDVPLDLRLARGFRRDVLAALPRVGYGATASYGQVAASVGRPAAVRAVGTACALNPVPVLLPCHRVVRADGTPGRYAGGDDAKSALIAWERGGSGPLDPHAGRA
ncbi:methylated-DNA/protein-cysteinemethyltransferase [Cellulomonas flavigena DSM 20109]|uniref:methylated-DNA--[protein]-cysteine S-methyltransferase n=1 Tax=Cellulomonas flavigena (strain ATCC 482 / DSM 20109 / BCRC 11376 / JCM 18109 / NBRC 3775 / NCIMB 8073 / NRS 134) TaxID=446466 RepID=D5UEZ7_CELFN|nr:methylated-DNA--[protein]-cysteine S-methyltransferase [Cellulomonas flavigena]ADG74807.1 methylated-DNA/protein-cysteinemethyltransferase [Cellulomonas flavigena DSM 20109]